ncbi:hypothetical protein CANCADRAFT_84206 [Tortispora caseinolytica NRRL Y-17796]|uniref:ER transporter 6TM N-terminal domain-containing protein n=1 Tax=Tortispora caseinolytica NRRL Y-17796 TaxID=767744 RepID=A0A1E4TKH0_9ASCO|nr:hypothetical protein CANCADRAFT_84206 [Tortispora caseinolytica NRRL Y-17796]
MAESIYSDDEFPRPLTKGDDTASSKHEQEHSPEKPDRPTQSSHAQSNSSNQRKSVFQNIISSISKYIDNKFTPLNWQDLIRCGIPLWIGFVFMNIPATSHYFSLVVFLCPIMATVVAPFAPYILMAMILMLTLTCALWSMAVNLAAQGIAHRLRGGHDVSYYVEQATIIYNCTAADASACFTRAVQDGQFLQTNVSAIYLAALFIDISCLIYLKGLNRMFIPSAIVGIIIGCVCNTFSPLFPQFFPDLPIMMLKAAGIELALIFVCSLLIFPKTINSMLVKNLIKISSSLTNIISIHRDCLEASVASEQFAKYMEADEIVRSTAPVIGQLRAFTPFASSELSFCRLSDPEIGSIADPLFKIVLRLSSVKLFFQNLYDRQITQHRSASISEILHRQSSLSSRGSNSFRSKLRRALHKSYGPVGEIDYLHEFDIDLDLTKFPTDRLDHILAVVRESCGDCVAAAADAIQLCTEWLKEVDRDRLFTWIFHRSTRRQKELAKQVVKARSRLRDALVEFENNKSGIMIRLYREGLFDHDLFTMAHGFLYQVYAEEAIRKMLEIMDRMMEIDAKHPEPRLNFPKFASFYKNISEFQSPEDLGLEGAALIAKKHTQRRNADALPPKTISHLIGRKLHAFYNSFFSDDVMFAIKLGLAAVLCALPAVFKSTAHFFLANRGSWALIMVGLTASRSTGQTIGGVIIRIIATFVGSLAGMIAWYISAGSSTSSTSVAPLWGFAATTFVCSWFLMYFRLHYKAKNPMPNILLPISFVLVISLSFAAVRIQSIFPAIPAGYTVAWKRFVIVTIGVSIGFLVSIFPHPNTSKSFIRKTLGDVIDSIAKSHSDLLGFTLSKVQNPAFPPLKSLADEFLSTSYMIGTVREEMLYVPYEPSFDGPWPSKTYNRVVTLASEANSLLSLIYSMIQRFDSSEWLAHCIETSGLRDKTFAGAEFSMLFMMSRALLLNAPIPQVTPAPLVPRFIELVTTSAAKLQAADGTALTGLPEDEEEELTENKPNDTTDNNLPTLPAQRAAVSVPAFGTTTQSTKSFGTGTGSALERVWTSSGTRNHKRHRAYSDVSYKERFEKLSADERNHYGNWEFYLEKYPILFAGKKITPEMAKSKNFRYYAANVILDMTFYDHIDRLMLYIKALVGEVYENPQLYNDLWDKVTSDMV